MANPIASKPKVAEAAPTSAMSMIAPAIGWLIPGAGHMVQKRWVRGALLLISIGAMFTIGLAMEGRVYRANSGDILEMLGFVGDLGAGGLYFLALAMDWGTAVAPHATADYGKVFIIVAGLLNFMSVADAYHIAIGKKQ